MILKTGTRPGVADPDGVAVIRGAHPRDRPGIRPELKRSTMVAGRVSGLCRLGGCDAIKTVPNTTDSETLRQGPSAPRTGRTPAEATLRSSRNTGLSPDFAQVTPSPWYRRRICIVWGSPRPRRRPMPSAGRPRRGGTARAHRARRYPPPGRHPRYQRSRCGGARCRHHVRISPADEARSSAPGSTDGKTLRSRHHRLPA